MVMKDVIVVINHVQDSYLDPKNPVDVALRQKINDYVEQIRPFVKGIAWSFAHGKNASGIEFDAAHERSPSWRPGDIELVNNEGKGQDSGFLQKLNAAQPGAVILAGVYFEACSKGTATTIKEGLGIPVAVPQDLADAPDPQFSYHYESVAKEMAQNGIDVKSSCDELLQKVAAAPYNGPGVSPPAEFKLPQTVADATPQQQFTIRPIRDGDENAVCRLLGGDTSKVDFDDPKHPVNETVKLIEASRDPNAKGGGWIALVDNKPVGVVSTANMGGALAVDDKFSKSGIAEALATTRDNFQPPEIKAAAPAQKMQAPRTP